MDEEERAERIRYLLALEIATIVDDLEARQAFLVDIWGRHRDRGPFLDTIFSRFKTLDFNDLALLEKQTIAKVHAFYKELDEFKLYLQFTEDMPTSLADAYVWQLTRLNAFAEVSVEALGGAPEPVVVDIPEPEALPDHSPEDRPLLELSRFEKDGPDADD